MAVPETADEARARGYELKKLSLEEARQVMEESAPAGADISSEKRLNGCSTLPAGSKCWEGDCIGGTKEVLYCDGTQGCTIYGKVDC